MSRRSLATLALPLLVLAACATPAAAPPATPPAVTAPAAPVATRTTLTDLAPVPKAPPLMTWVTKSNSDFQQTLDLNMQTAMISHLNIATRDADATAARDLAHFICTGIRDGVNATEQLKKAYPLVAMPDTLSVTLAAQAYCLDTV